MTALRPFLVWSVSGLMLAGLWLHARHLRQERETVLARTMPAHQTIAQEQAAIVRLTRLIEVVDADAAELRRSAEPATPAARPAGEAPLDPPDRHARLARDPAYQLAQLELRQAELRLNYSPLYRQLKLSPEAIAGFEAAEAKHEEAKQDLIAAAKEQGLAFTDKSLQPLWEKIARERFEAHQTFLGAEGAKAWRQFDRTRHVRQFVAGIAGAAALAGVPLNRAQADAAVEAITSIAGPKYVALNRVDWTAADARARAVLSPEQFRIYHSIAPIDGTSRPLVAFSAALRRALASEPAEAGGANSTAAP